MNLKYEDEGKAKLKLVLNIQRESSKRLFENNRYLTNNLKA